MHKQRGRPKKNGEKPFWMLVRDTAVVYAYGRARNRHEKHSVAISEAIRHVRATYPLMPISETEVKRILAAWRARKRATCLFVDKPDPGHSEILYPGRDGKFRYFRIAYTASIGQHPNYPRTNAVEKPF